MQRRVSEFISGICRIPDLQGDLSVRRELTLELLMQLLDADFGHWAWGRGKPMASGVVPIALITRGYSDIQKAQLMQMSLDPETTQAFRIPILKRMGDDPQDTSVRTQIVPDDEWVTSRMRSLMMLFSDGYLV